MAQDRNERARQQFQLARARKQFADAVGSGQVPVIDRFGNQVEIGAHVIWFPPPYGLNYIVKDIAPVLDPGAPPGLMKITLVCEVPAVYQAGTPAKDMLLIQRGGMAEGAEAVEAQEPAEPPSPITLTDAPDAPTPPETSS